jgi:hypothetical protein
MIAEAIGWKLDKIVVGEVEHGDHGTVALPANTIPKVVRSPPGLYTMKDLPVPSAFF